MINRIDKKFKELKRQNRKAFIAYVTAGDPDLGMTKRIVLALEESGVDLVEQPCARRIQRVVEIEDPVADMGEALIHRARSRRRRPIGQAECGGVRAQNGGAGWRRTAAIPTSPS